MSVPIKETVMSEGHEEEGAAETKGCHERLIWRAEIVLSAVEKGCFKHTELFFPESESDLKKNCFCVFLTPCQVTVTQFILIT